jgi:4'-phosphopantetheinyl transferase
MGNPPVADRNPVWRPGDNEVHIWRLEPEPLVDLSRYSDLLSRDEQQRAARFRFPHLTRNFIADHGRMRLILGAYTGLAPQNLVFALNEFGKPELADYPASLRFNLSHTEGLSLLALCLDSPVGIDLEAVRQMNDWRDVAQSHFSQNEVAALHEMTESDQQNAFFRCWTRKEAFLKAHGFGLSIPLDSFAVSLDRERTPALLECKWDPEETKRWSFVSLDLGAKFIGALAIAGKNWRIRYLDWSMYRSSLLGTAK